MAFFSAVMWLPLLVLSVTTHVPPINASETSNEEQPVVYRPTSLDDCKNMAEWKSFYELCVRIVTNEAPDFLLWEEGELTSLPNPLAKSIFPEYEGGSSNELADRSEDDATTKDLAVGGYTFGKRLQGHGGDFLRLKKQEALGLPTLHSSGAVLRRRRQHSLSINSALVSLADMLIAKDYNRKQSRQKDFRQQLLGLGR